MRIVITGASGFIGWKFVQVLSEHEVQGLGFSRPRAGLTRLDLRDRRAVGPVLADFRPDAVIHCAARPGVDWCEEHPDEARALNLDPTLTLIDECARLGALLVFLSSDYVFDGEAGPYRETDPTRPLNEYGRLKRAGEEAIRSRIDRHLIIRTTNIYGLDFESKNFLMAILPRIARGEHVEVPHDQWGSPTLVDDFCAAVGDLIAEGHTGTFHVVGPDLATRLEWARAAARTFGLDPNRVVGRSTAELGQPARRPLRSGLRTDKLRAVLGRPMLGMDAGLRVMRDQQSGRARIETREDGK